MIYKSGLNSPDSEWGPMAGSYEHSNESSGSIQGGNYLNFVKVSASYK